MPRSDERPLKMRFLKFVSVFSVWRKGYFPSSSVWSVLNFFVFYLPFCVIAHSTGYFRLFISQLNGKRFVVRLSLPTPKTRWTTNIYTQLTRRAVWVTSTVVRTCPRTSTWSATEERSSLTTEGAVTGPLPTHPRASGSSGTHSGWLSAYTTHVAQFHILL